MDLVTKEYNHPSAPEALLLTAREIDELYDLLDVLVGAFKSLNIPYILIAGSLLGSVRSKSILFNDDDIDVAIIDDAIDDDQDRDEMGVYDRLKKQLPELLNEAADRRNFKQQLEKEYHVKPSATVKYMYQIRPWVGCDRIRSSADPRVWIDIFVLKRYTSIDSLEQILSLKQNGESQSTEYVQAIMTKMYDSVTSPHALDEIFPLYHYDNRKAIELWPKEYFSPHELFPLHQSFSFGPLHNLSGPHMPIRLLHRFFGSDCFTYYYKADAHVRGKKSMDDYLSWDQCEKLPLTDDMYLPIQHSKRKNDGRYSNHSRQTLMEYIEKQMLIEDFHSETVAVPSVQARLHRNHTENDLENPKQQFELSRSQTFVANQEIKEQSKWFGAAVRRHMNDSSDLPVFDQALREVMEPHITKARNRRKDCLHQLYQIMSLPKKIDVKKISIASNIGIPYPQLRVERPFLFDVETYPLDRILAAILGVSDLSLLHTHEIRDKYALLKPLLDPSSREPFHRCFDNFVTQFCIPLLHSLGITERLFLNSGASQKGPQQVCYRYQAFPCIRVVRPGEFSIGPHCDISYGLSLGNINFHVPLTAVYGTNPLFIESHPGREDWHPLLTKSVGLGFIFDGARCLHFTLENTTDTTRVSLDFRISISRPTAVLFQRPSRIYSSWKFGEMQLSDDADLEDLDDTLCCETILLDRFALNPGYYEEAFVDLGFGESQTFLSTYSLVHKKNTTLIHPDYRVGFPFSSH